MSDGFSGKQWSILAFLLGGLLSLLLFFWGRLDQVAGDTAEGRVYKGAVIENRKRLDQHEPRIIRLEVKVDKLEKGNGR